MRRYDGSGSSVSRVTSVRSLPCDQVALEVDHRVLDADVVVTTGARPEVEQVHAERRDQDRDHDRESRGDATDRAGAGARPGRHREGLRLGVAVVLRQDRAPARDLLGLREEDHREEPDRGERVEDPVRALAGHAHRHAVDRQQRQPGQGDAAQGAGEDVDEQQARGAAGDQQRVDGRLGGGDRWREPVRALAGVLERGQQPVPRLADRQRRAAHERADHHPHEQHLGEHEQRPRQPPPATDRAGAGDDDRDDEQRAERGAEVLGEPLPGEQRDQGGGRGDGRETDQCHRV